MNPVIDRPALPEPVRAMNLVQIFTQYGHRLNNVMPKDGSEAMTGRLLCAAPTTALASLNLPHGTAPSSPNDGDVWTTTAGIFVRVNGSTVGPLS